MMTQKEVNDKLAPAMTHFREAISGVRTNRPTPKLIENIRVNYLEQQLSVKQLGSIGIQPPREIHISCWDPAAAPAVAAAIEAAGLGLVASPDGSLVRVVLPALTDERRTEFKKLVGRIAEETRIRIRGIRDELNRRVEAEFKAKQITEDARFKSRTMIQKAVDSENAAIEAALTEKIIEISE